MDPKDQLKDLHRIAKLGFNPAPMYVYKPRPDGTGVALKLNLRMEVKMSEAQDGAEYVEEVDGGLFLDIVGQAGKTDDGKHAKFAWSDDAKKVSAKLGLNDQLGFLTAIREVRYRGKPVPTPLRNKREEDPAKAVSTLSLFHKFGNSSTGITYNFTADGGSLRLSKSAQKWKAVNLTLMDEMQFERYLNLALDAYLSLGVR